MVINITSEIQKAFDVYLDDAVDWDFVGTPITRRMLSGTPASIVDYAAGWQASRKQALSESMERCADLLANKPATNMEHVAHAQAVRQCISAIRSLEGNATKETT